MMTRLSAFFWNRAWLLLALGVFMWGLNSVASKLAVNEISPLMLVCLRWAIVCLLIYVLVRDKFSVAYTQLKRFSLRFLLMAGFGFTGFNALFYCAAYHTTSVNISLIQGTIPVLILTGAIILGYVKLHFEQVFGIVLSFVGICIVAIKGDVQNLFLLRFNSGDILILLACVFYAGYALSLRKKPDFEPLLFFFALSLMAFLTSIPLFLFELFYAPIYLPTLNGLGVLVFIAIFPSFIAQIFFIRGVALIGPSRAGIFINLLPVFGALASVAILHEAIAFYHFIALALVLGGIIIAEYKNYLRAV